jgi:predicted chitinase
VPLNLALMLADARSHVAGNVSRPDRARVRRVPLPRGDRVRVEAYEGRADLGNTQPGDGVRFKGRGWIQITGRKNYAAAADALKVDLVEHPELAAKDDVAAKAAAWFWTAHGLNRFADARDVRGCTRLINGGFNGLVQREALYKRALVALEVPPPLAVA